MIYKCVNRILIELRVRSSLSEKRSVRTRPKYIKGPPPHTLGQIDLHLRIRAIQSKYQITSLT